MIHAALGENGLGVVQSERVSAQMLSTTLSAPAGGFMTALVIHPTNSQAWTVVTERADIGSVAPC